MAINYVGTIVLTVNGKEYDCVSFAPKGNSGHKPVSTMNSEGRVRGVAKVTKAGTFSLEVVIPENDAFDWQELQAARITVQSQDGQFRTTYSECYSENISEQFQDGNEAKRSIDGFYLRKIREQIAA